MRRIHKNIHNVAPGVTPLDKESNKSRPHVERLT
jgi:hypothetical protein